MSIHEATEVDDTEPEDGAAEIILEESEGEPSYLPVPFTAGTSLPVPVGENRDALSLYFAELKNCPPISREEEHELAVKFVEEEDVDAARKLVASNLRLVVKIAMEYRRAWASSLDLIQEGNTGLMQAVHRYDPYKGVRLSSYAAYWVRAYILKYIIDNIRLVRMGKTRAQRKLFYRLNKEKRLLEQQGYEVLPTLLAERLDVGEDDVIEMEQRLAFNDQSMDAPVGDSDGRFSLSDVLPSTGASAEESFGNAELREVFLEKVATFLEGIDERDRRIVDERILAEEPKTLQELGDELGLTRERVRQLEARTVNRLRKYLEENFLDFKYYTTDDN
jgi:RNA polymerase sigma-32 factor